MTVVGVLLIFIKDFFVMSEPVLVGKILFKFANGVFINLFCRCILVKILV